MAAMRGPRLQVGSGAWIAEERNAALQIAQSEVEEFSYSARNELDWLNEHMAGIFNENETNFVETFKTPGKLRGKTPRTAKKTNPLETRVPLSEVFSATPNRATSPINRIQSPGINEQVAVGSPSPLRPSTTRIAVFSPKQATHGTQDSGYFGSQDVAPMNIHMDTDLGDGQSSPQTDATRATSISLKISSTRPVIADSLEKALRSSNEDQIARIAADSSKKIGAGTRFDLGRESGSEDDVSPERQLSLEAKHTLQYADDARSASDGSSPIRPVVRKSSLNFASLPAREPLTAGKSNGARVSRPSHLDHVRTSYYNRQTGGKSLGGTLAKVDREENQENEMDVDDDMSQAPKAEDTKSYTQRLQDQINMLGQSQPKMMQGLQQSKTPAPKTASPIPLHTLQSTPGAFPEDDDDDWIEPPATVGPTNEERPSLPKSYSADVMEGIQGKKTIGQPDFTLSDDENSGASQLLAKGDIAKSAYGHVKAASVPVIPNVRSAGGEIPGLKKVVSVSNPSLTTVTEAGVLHTPSKSPSRSFRESPLKQVKNKLSSILKSSRGLLASSAAISAEGKSLMSPSSTRLGLHSFMSSESVATLQRIDSSGSQRTAVQREASPSRPLRRTRASAEKEDKRREKEAKRLEEQNDRLEKARQKERDKARVFSKEQERLAAMEKHIAAKKGEDQSSIKETSKPTRSGLRNAKAMEEDTVSIDKDVDMEDIPAVPPPSSSHSVGSTHATRNRELKRPVKPTREMQTRPKQAPTVIRVNTGSQHSQYRLSSAQPDAVNYSGTQPHQLTSNAGKTSLQTKASTQSMRGAAASATGRGKAQELAARKKDHEEREAQRRRDAKAEIERKKTAAQEDQRRQEQLKRQEAERQRQPERVVCQPQSKTNAQRKAAIEKAKQTRAPPPAVRTQPNGPPDLAMSQEGQPPRPPSRMASNAHWGQEELTRPVNAVLSNASKAGGKRAFTQDKGDDGQAKRPPSRGGPVYQANEAKRRRTSEPCDEEVDTSSQKNIRGPPVRPSAAFKKELPSKSIFQSGYANVPQSGAPNLFKATVSSQYVGQMKAVHPLELAQISKGAIPFQPASNTAGPAYKTPGRPGPANGVKSGAKSATRSSPRFQNGEGIELPEIQTDDDSEDDEANGVTVAPWADSPALRGALVRQETMDPSQIFGPPAPLNMEEVFNKSKDRFHKFRARTSSANWSGADRLTEEDIRKDLIARDKLRRDGGWSYEMSRDVL
ncbi:hypothetical protein QQS21_010657 [Conoideocrella luteorostrata]|uniref:Inner centromere protein ARK-binding domain-containing protein n=1 Tax=Conoideocrella luteorostrata TaxID=1105319 RepID=A0AAJ0FUG2_9HYPO|nr:hypothetical protein QQS21_010657 [Conoideocrella luteorostrata]